MGHAGISAVGGAVQGIEDTIRRAVIALGLATWSIMTALCGLARNFPMLLAARIGTAIGEAGGSPPSHSLISDYFSLKKRGTALSLYALGVPLGGMLGLYLGGHGNDWWGWRTTFIVAGLPGVAVALLVALTVSYPFQVVALVSALYLVSIPFAWQSHRKLLLADRNLASDDDGDCEDTDLDHLGDKHKGDAS